MDEYTGGMAEVVKHALIGDVELMEVLEENLVPVFTRRDGEAVARTIERAVRVKAEIVAADERESGRRAVLNFGHTFAHAIERVAGYGAFSHGEAVAVGMRAGLYLSHRRHPEALPRTRADDLIRAIPVDADPSALSFDALYDAMTADKKNEGGTIRFVLLRRLGEAYVTGDVSRAEAEQAWAFACSA
jgi:3-dehydroquinate synthase